MPWGVEQRTVPQHSLAYFAGAYITSAKDVMEQMKPEAANFSFREAARQTLEAYASIADLTALLSSPDITKKELLTILGKGVAESAVGDLLFIIDNADMFAQFGSLTPEQAWELGGRTVGAIVELAEIGLTVYSLAKGAEDLLASKGIYKSAGETAKLPPNDSQLKHIFRNADGHLPDTPANRILVESTANNSKYFIGNDAYGTRWYAKLQPDGSQIWVRTYNGTVINAGVNTTPRIFDPQTGLNNNPLK